MMPWKDTPGALRAVTGALPILRLAASVSVVSLGPSGSEEGADEAAGLPAFPGIRATASTRSIPEGLDETEALLAFVDQILSHLVVPGACGHGRLRE